MHIKVILFDCWGTLFFTETRYLSQIAQDIGEDIKDRQFLKTLEEAIMSAEHNDLKKSFGALIHKTGMAPNAQLANKLNNDLVDALPTQRPYPEALETLTLLKKSYRLGMITNSSSVAFEYLTKHYSLNQIFDVMLPSYETHIIKPDPAVFRLALSKFDANPDETIMVGDTLADDIEAAEVVGITGVLIDRDNQYPDYPKRISSLTELAPLIASQ